MAFHLTDPRAAFDGRHLIASLNESQLTIWKTNPPVELATVEIKLDAHSQRQAFDPINRVIYSGMWEGGLTAYDLDTREALWHRGDLVGIQKVDLSGGFPT